MRRNTSLPRLGSRLASTVAALATWWSTTLFAQQPALPSPPPVTAIGVQNTVSSGSGLVSPGGSAIGLSVTAGTATVGTATGGTATGGTAPRADPMLAQLDMAIDVSSRRFLTANVHSPWQIFHGLLALKQEFQLNLGNTKVNAIQWIATSEPKFDNQPLLLKTPHGGKFHSFTRPYAFEGHPAQFLALLSQSDLPVGYAFKVGSDRITLAAIINNTMKEVNDREEVTWVLWGLQHYLQPDAQWLNQVNEPWSIERLVQIETSSPVVGAPCGGNHRLFALTRTRDKHLKQGGKLTGTWLQTDHKIRQHIEIARSLQNHDGSFSSKFYETSGFSNDLNQRFNTTGHTMEFLSIGLPNERLHEPWVRNAVGVLCSDLIVNRQRQIDCGPLYHTLNSLIIYRERIRTTPLPAGSTPESAPLPLAVQPTKPTPSVSPSPNPVLTKPTVGTKTVEAKPVTSEKLLPEVPKSPMGVVSETLMPPVKSQPSVEALNELKLDGAFRDRLNALTGPRPLPANIPPDASARPLESSGQPVLQETDDASEGVSALAPENH